MSKSSIRKSENGIIEDAASDYLWHLDDIREKDGRIFTYPSNHRMKPQDFEEKPLSRPSN